MSKSAQTPEQVSRKVVEPPSLEAGQYSKPDDMTLRDLLKGTLLYVGALDWTISRAPFQPQRLCDSVLSAETGYGCLGCCSSPGLPLFRSPLTPARSHLLACHMLRTHMSLEHHHSSQRHASAFVGLICDLTHRQSSLLIPFTSELHLSLPSMLPGYF